MSFFAALGLLLAVIVFGNLISRLGAEKTPQEQNPKQTAVYTIGESPKVSLQAQVNQEGIIEIIAQTPGIIQEVFVTEGESVYAGQPLASLSTNYQGGNIPGLQAQLVGTQYKNIKETYGVQKELLSKQREIAQKTGNNAEELRKISENAKNDTKGLLEQNETILNTLTNQLIELEQNSATDAQILQAQQLKAQAQAGVNQLRSGLRQLEYTTNTNNPPSALSELQKEISLKQLDLQEKAIELSKETSRIQYNVALIQASLMRPAAPFAGIVEKLSVSPGTSVNPGTVIAVLSSHNPKASLTVLAPKYIAERISRIDPSVFQIQGEKVLLTPSYISSVPTNNQLYTVLYNLPEHLISKVTNNAFITVEIPVGYPDSIATVPFIPIDSVFQSQNASYVFVEQGKKAVSKEVTLGIVYGNFVEVTSGIKNGDKIILNRTVVSGEKIEIIQ